MGFNIRRFSYIRIFLILLFVLLFVIYIYAAKFYVPSLIRNQLKGLEEDRNIVLRVKNVNMDLIRGIVFNDILLGNEPGDSRNQITIKKLIFKPKYFESLTEQRLLADYVNIHEPRLEICRQLFELIGKLSSDETEKDSEATGKLEINNLNIDDLSINLSRDTKVRFKKLNVELSKLAETNEILITGEVDTPGKGKTTEFSSGLEIKKDKKLEVNINFPDVGIGDYSSHIHLPEDASLSIFTEIDYRDQVLTTGSIGITGTGSEEIGSLEWKAQYVDGKNSMELDYLRGGITDLLDMDLKGSLGALPDNRIARLEGKIDITDVSKLSDRFGILKKFDLKGSFIADELNISKSDDTLGFNTGFTAKGFDIDFGEGDRLRASELESVQNLDFLIVKGDGSSTYKVSGKEFGVKGFSYLDFETEVSDISEFNFSYNSDLWGLSLNAAGPVIENSSIDAGLCDYNLDLKVEREEKIEVTGEIKSPKGRYSTFNLNELVSRFQFQPGNLTFSELETVVEKYGNLNIDKGVLVFPSKVTPEYVVEIYSGKYHYFDYPVIADDFRALFSIKPDEQQNSAIEGKVISKEGSVFGNRFNDLSFDFNSYLDEYKVSNILAEFLRGKLNGDIDFKSTGDNIDYNLTLVISDPEYTTIGLDLYSKEFRFESRGTYADGLLYDSSGIVDIKSLSIGKESQRVFNASFEIAADPETISFNDGFISNETGGKFSFTGYLRNYDRDNSLLKFSAPDIPLEFLIDLFSDYLPDNTFLVDVEGSVMIDFEADSFYGNYDRWNGIFKINNSTVSAYISDTDILIEDMEGVVSIKDKSDIDHKLSELLGARLTINRNVYKNYLEVFREKAQLETKDFIKIGKIKYGFFDAYNIECNFEMDKEKMNLLFLKSDVYGGHVFANGLINFGTETEKYNINMLFSDLSLENISNSIPSMEGYITGLVDGLLWFTVGDRYTTIDGPFAFWARDSKQEKRTIGRALLEKIGAKGRFFTGSSRRYDHGEIAGYIKDGLITFQKFIISNKILGYTDLKIQADKKMNSISVKHLFSVIRELARRASKGDIEIEYQ